MSSRPVKLRAGPPGSRKAPGVPPDAHEWVSFEDLEEQRTWVFDVTFLLSSWNCIYGNGCQGVLTGPAPELEQGCCSYGAHFTDQADVQRVRAAARTLTADQWQHKPAARHGGATKTSRDGTTTTRLVDDACIFLNRPGFPGGAGCALHRAALERGQEPMDLKPDVCWQLPLRREDRVLEDGQVVSTISEWDRRHWGEGGSEFHWWCTEAPEAFTALEPLYRTMSAELRSLVGDATYERLCGYLEVRRERPEPLLHPQERSAPSGSST